MNQGQLRELYEKLYFHGVESRDRVTAGRNPTVLTMRGVGFLSTQLGGTWERNVDAYLLF